MKAAPFTFIRPATVAEALEVLALHGSDCKPLAGGGSLVPMMAMRLARPAVLMDINRLPELKSLTIDSSKATMGATVRQRDAEAHGELARAVPLIGAALRWVGHVQTRNRGTIGGSIFHGDPAAELPLAAAILDAMLILRSRDAGDRRVSAAEFFVGPMFNTAGEAECLMTVEWPVWQGKTVACAFEEVSIRHGDFAMTSAACQLQFDDDGTCRRAAIGLGGVAGTPLAFPDLAEAMIGHRIDASLARDIAEAAVSRSEPGSDVHADAAYRRHLAVVLLRRALLNATARAASPPALAA